VDDAARESRAAEAVTLLGADLSAVMEAPAPARQAELPVDTSETSDNGLFRGDPSLPLANAKHEHFLRCYLASRNAGIAYRDAISPQCRMDTAAQQASRIMKRADVRGRLRWLLLKEKADQADPVAGKPMTLGVKISELEKIILQGTPSDRVRAIQEHNRLTGHGRPKADGVPDPAYLAEYLRRAEDLGVAPVSLANEEAAGIGEGEPSAPVLGHSEDDSEGEPDIWAGGGK